MNGLDDEARAGLGRAIGGEAGVEGGREEEGGVFGSTDPAWGKSLLSLDCVEDMS